LRGGFKGLVGRAIRVKELKKVEIKEDIPFWEKVKSKCIEL
jgi:hypothetical protein